MAESPPARRRNAIEQPSHRTQLDIWGSEITPAIIREIAAVADVPPNELPPLTEIMDPDGLETLLSSAQDHLSVTFRYDEFLVTVSAEDDIIVQRF